MAEDRPQPGAPSGPGAPDEPPAGPAAPLVVVEGGRRRWLAVVVVAALLVVGAVAGWLGLGDEDAAPAPGAARRPLPGATA